MKSIEQCKHKLTHNIACRPYIHSRILLQLSSVYNTCRIFGSIDPAFCTQTTHGSTAKSTRNGTLDKQSIATCPITCLQCYQKLARDLLFFWTRCMYRKIFDWFHCRTHVRGHAGSSKAYDGINPETSKSFEIMCEREESMLTEM